ncbi:nickel-dependent hydrogenase large subunit [Pseudooceanicola sp. CBS1P-1]|uniref:HupV protein n=1 Tax=Pseudooceanicola albus TaxID=2692189 RepID=A0A6L7G7W2_9RHOB|nr:MULTISPECIES: nickel-dependent hydrogenase large subunit [Pseudooceanicola]MBT9384214.1 nickel-dependent hydrogenase large subunit [Pseudooceanicola endophyticus]MXN19687.1 HupV protein [Pseudooceanicola albus]
MNERQLIVGPFNRVEGDLEIRLEVRDGAVASAQVNAPLFRGFEMMLPGKDPRDALTITPRICGICSVSQSSAAALALADAGGIDMPPQGRIAAALLHGVENMADHVTHFHLFFMPDFARPGYDGRAWHDRALARFTAMEGSAARRATEARAQLLHIAGILGGKWPHTLAIQPGGVTKAPDAGERVRILATLRSFRRFLEDSLFGAPVEAFAALPDVAALESWESGDAGLFQAISADLGLEGTGIGPRRYLSAGAYPLDTGRVSASGVWEGGQITPFETGAITEDLSHAWMLGDTAHPARGLTEPDEDMADPGYSWCKAPRLAGRTVEVGALARQVVDRHPLALALAAEGSVRARIAGRLLEIARLQILLEDLARSLDPSAPFMAPAPWPRSGTGAGLVEAARGTLGHWLRIEEGRIAGYQIVAPTTWNFSPRDVTGAPGPVEAALVGAEVRPGEETPLSVQHIVRSFDPCMACTVH